jgi:hypothetical protein
MSFLQENPAKADTRSNPERQRLLLCPNHVIWKMEEAVKGKGVVT